MLEPFYLPEIIEGTNVVLYKRDHNYDNEMWLAIDSNRNFLRPYLMWVDKTDCFDSVTNATKHFNLAWASQAKFAYVIADKCSKKLLGSIDIHNIDLDNHSAEIGYWLKEDKTGYGYVSDALKQLEKCAFDAKINRLVITCDSRNRASANVAIRNGYKFESTNRKAIFAYGNFYDREVYAKLINE